MAPISNKSEANDFFNRSPLLATVRELSSGMNPDLQKFVAQQLVVLLQDYYVHLPLKRSSLGIDPVQEARLLVDEVHLIPFETDFFRRVFAILKRLRDRHTALRLPSPWRDMVTYLPFAIESYFDKTGRHLIVSKVMTDTEEPSFVAGVEITHWNGSSIRRYIESLSWETEGANPFARIAIALRSLTVRPLGYMSQPDEDWVTITFVNLEGKFKSVTMPWRVYIPPVDSAAGKANITASGTAGLYQGVDRNTLIVNKTWFDLYSQGAVSDEVQLVSPTWRNQLESRVVHGSSGDVGYIRIFSFDAPDSVSFLNEFANILRSLPPNGVIIDVRSNPGGTIPSGEALFGLFTNRDIAKERLSFRNTSAIRRIGSHNRFTAWKRSLEMQFETGDVFSQGFHLGPSDFGPKGIYSGPVVLVIDALCYSTTDFFAAGMQDNGLAAIIGVDPVTGAGGANVWNHVTLSQFVAESGGNDVLPMPLNIDIDVSLRRSTRVGPNEGLPVEGLGVFADFNYQLTRKDVLGKNEDLINFAAHILGTMGKGQK